MLFIIGLLYFIPGIIGFYRLSEEDRRDTSLLEFLIIITLVPWVMLGDLVNELLGQNINID